jgi:hypothetical protein
MDPENALGCPNPQNPAKPIRARFKGLPMRISIVEIVEIDTPISVRNLRY